MSLDKSFCSSPWIHMRINNSGQYEYCRWAVKDDNTSAHSIKTMSPITWFRQSEEIREIRKSLLNGDSPAGCAECMEVEKFGKISGRQRQLLKFGVNTESEESFNKTLLSSKWVDTLENSNKLNGITDQFPQDWQIDLGNYCNSSCIFCYPQWSSRIATEYKKIGWYNGNSVISWCNDVDALNEFINTLLASPKLIYLHFIGGETLITPAFKKILSELVSAGVANNITIGFTTNLTVWDQECIDLMLNFKQINVGLSVECFTDLNDYIRYGSNINTVKEIASKWARVSSDAGWLTQLRITPTLFSIWDLSTVYDFAFTNGLGVESCNFLADPKYMRISVLPDDIRIQAAKRLSDWISIASQDISKTSTSKIVNTRCPDYIKEHLIQDANSYVDFLLNAESEVQLLPQLIEFLHKIESSRKNSIIEYLPNYEKFLRAAGY